ncbi:hypothetical protein [Paraburkholderia phenazinium]|uniref:hypothetical protein n=1 Tax=Paraburkholderia phenazinium TaxID=60549 RepID=UPI00158D18B2|nr:hypothetical protein [Paraburkholderia phenazinium]
MSSFRVLVGNFAIVGTTGEAGGHQPAVKSEAVAFDVIDRRCSGYTAYLRRDQPFEAAWDFCAARLAIEAARKLH